MTVSAKSGVRRLRPFASSKVKRAKTMLRISQGSDLGWSVATMAMMTISTIAKRRACQNEVDTDDSSSKSKLSKAKKWEYSIG